MFYNLIVEDIGESILSVSFKIKNIPSGYSSSYYTYIAIESNEKTFTIFDQSDKGTKKVKEVHPKRGNDALKKTTNILATQTYAVSISGKVQYFDYHQYLNKGVYGNSVELWFRNTNSPDNWYHPVYSSNCTGQEHVHYDLLDIDGNYNFNFSFTGDLSAYNQLIIIVTRNNDATYMPLQSNGIRSWCNNTYTDFFSLAEGIQQNFNGSQSTITYTNLNALVNSGDGAIFRNMKLSKEFIFQRYNGNTPFSVPPVYTIQTTLSDNIAGLFYPSDGHIEIDYNSEELSTTSHEYGHYINYKMWDNYLINNDGCSDALGNTIPNAGRTYKEGWAVFYSFATRNYANKIYGEDLREWDDNCETAPYKSPRFSNMRYTSVDPNIPAFACYLWNLYDNYDGGIFEATTYAGDNDDINGLSDRVFETMRSPIKDCTSKYNSQFKSGLSSELQTSVDKNYSFMLVNSAIPPLPAQVKNASISLISGNQLQFQWASQSYYGSPSYNNSESGYKIYKNVSTSWQLIYTAVCGTTSYNYTTSDLSSTYMITSYNSTGNSSSAPQLKLLTTSISGPTNIVSGQNGTWTASASGGYPPYHYQWYYQYPDNIAMLSKIVPNLPPSGYWFATGTDSPNLTTNHPQDFELKCQVTDTHTSTTSNILYVSIGLEKGSIPIEANQTRIPVQFDVKQNYPNPFNPSTKISYSVPTHARINIKIYNVLGNEVKELINDFKEAGYYSVDFNASNLPSGMYLYRIIAYNNNEVLFTNSKQMLLLK